MNTSSVCAACGSSRCRFASTSLPALAELADMGDVLAQRHLVAPGSAGLPLVLGESIQRPVQQPVAA